MTSPSAFRQPFTELHDSVILAGYAAAVFGEGVFTNLPVLLRPPLERRVLVYAVA